MAENEEDNREQEEVYRFFQDLEFVQCLANPNYLKYLSDKGYLDNDNFINYLKYLLYFKKVEYMKYITYERCLIFLELLQYKEFREQLKQNNYYQINSPVGLQILSYAQYLDSFILRNWIDRSRLDKNDINNNEKNNNNEIDIKKENNDDKSQIDNQKIIVEN